MTNREAYVLGFVFGLLNRSDELKTDFAVSCARPLTGLAKVLAEARLKKILTPEIELQISEALSEIEPEEPEEGPEKVQPLEVQGSWQLGYYAARGGKPLAGAKFDICAARRRKGVTQEELAAQMGVDQALVSRWETGKVSPNKKNMERLKEVLN